MSKRLVVKTKNFITGSIDIDLLKKTLNELNIKYTAVDSDAILIDGYRAYGVDFIIHANGEAEYDDTIEHKCQALLKNIRQTYSIEYMKQKANELGYSVLETKNENNGNVRITLGEF